MNDFSDNENGIGAAPNDKPKKDADKPVEANTDIEGGNGPVSTTAEGSKKQ